MYAAFDLVIECSLLNSLHGGSAEDFGPGCSTEGQCTLAQIFGDLAESQRLLLFTPVTCSLTGVHQMLQPACTVPCTSSSGDVIAKVWSCLGLHLIE